MHFEHVVVSQLLAMPRIPPLLWRWQYAAMEMFVTCSLRDVFESNVTPHVSGMRIGCHVNVADSYTFGKKVLVC